LHNILPFLLILPLIEKMILLTNSKIKIQIAK